MSPRDAAVAAAVALVAAFAAFDALRGGGSEAAPSPPPAVRISAHVAELIASDAELNALRSSRRDCRVREVAALCFDPRGARFAGFDEVELVRLVDDGPGHSAG